MDTIIPFQRRASASDYSWDESMQCYVLGFERRARPGSLTDDPAVGAHIYNFHLDHAPALKGEQRSVIDRLKLNIDALLAGELAAAFSGPFRVILLHFADPSRFRFLNTEELEAALLMSAEEREQLYAAFWYASVVRARLTPGEVARLALQGR